MKITPELLEEVAKLLGNEHLGQNKEHIFEAPYIPNEDPSASIIRYPYARTWTPPIERKDYVEKISPTPAEKLSKSLSPMFSKWTEAVIKNK